jgi:hypothetical protein
MPMRQNHIGGDFYEPHIEASLRMASLRKTVAADEPLLTTYPPVLYLDPNGGARTVLLPPEADSKGLTFFIRNVADAAELLTIEEDSAATTIATLAQNEGCMFHCDGTTWRAFETDIA